MAAMVEMMCDVNYSHEWPEGADLWQIMSVMMMVMSDLVSTLTLPVTHTVRTVSPN